MGDFYPRSPCGERRLEFCDTAPHIYFYPRSPCGERLVDTVELAGSMLFLSTLSLRRATNSQQGKNNGHEFLSTLSLRRATVTVLGIQHRVGISIHALLAESDCISSIINNVIDNFYPRSPCGERPSRKDQSASIQAFLSTLSLRRATRGGCSLLS